MPKLTPFTKAKIEEFDRNFPQDLIRKSLNWGIEDDPKSDIKSFLSTALQEQQEGFMGIIKEAHMDNDSFIDLLEELKTKGLIS